MKLIPALLLSTLFSAAAFAYPVNIPDYNYSLTDVLDRGVTKEQMFSQMDRSFMKLGNSVCANRALVWLNDFNRFYGVHGAKIFLFYTDRTGGEGSKEWWYHVAPVIAERGQLYVLDAGFTFIDQPLYPQVWMNLFAKNSECKEIQADETDLVQLMNEGRQFPSNTRYGNYNCYYKIVPEGLWFPQNVAQSLEGGYVSNTIQPQDVFDACVEASTTNLGRFFGSGKDKCKKYLGFSF
jgi:hypothetical protein